MSEQFYYSTRYKLDKAYLTECFEQSVVAKPFIQAYQKAFAFMLFGMVLLLFTELNRYILSFFVALGFIEALSVRFQQPWWVTRQLLGKSGNSEVELTIDESGIAIMSPYIKLQYQWPEIETIQTTAKGYILAIAGARQYLSASILSAEAVDFMKKHIEEA